MELSKKPVKQATAVRQASLVEAAVRLAAQGSPAGITTADLARAVGITQGAVFRHFASKEAIWLAVLDWTIEALMSCLNAAADAQTRAVPALRAVFLAHVDFVMAHPGVPRVIFQELQQVQDTPVKAHVRELMQRYRQLLMRLLQGAQAARDIAPETDLNAATLLFIGALQGLVMQSLISGQVDAMAVQAPGVFDIYRRGLGGMASLSASQGNP